MNWIIAALAGALVYVVAVALPLGIVVGRTLARCDELERATEPAERPVLVVLAGGRR